MTPIDTILTPTLKKVYEVVWSYEAEGQGESLKNQVLQGYAGL